MTTEEKFKAAVSVIKNLPKNGPYQPSTELLLIFYSYYKQATVGWERRGSRPPFWDLVGKTKYDAWASLGQMSKETAMEKYVEQLNKIVETMALTDNVADFLTSVDSYNGNIEDLELCIGATLDKVRSQPSSPFGSRDVSPARIDDHSPKLASGSRSPTPTEEDEEFFVDSVEEPEFAKRHFMTNGVQQKRRIGNGMNEDVSEVLQLAIEKLFHNLSAANERIKTIEQQMHKTKNDKFDITSLSTSSITFIIFWPIAVALFSHLITRRRQTN